VKRTVLVKPSGVLMTLAVCCACSGSPAIAPSGAGLAAGYIGATATLNARPVTARPTTLEPYDLIHERLGNSKSQKYEYIINNYGSYASVFDFPKSTKQTGTIDDVGGQGCSNVLYGYGKKTFWIVAAANKIAEYEVPHKPVKTLSSPDGSAPSSCAMNTGGDLAVGILHGTDSGDIILYEGASGKGTAIATPLAQEYFDGYDDKGNLFFDGFTGSSAFQLDEMVKGTKKIQTISTSNTVNFPGSVQWDGTYLTVTDQLANVIYQYKILGSKAMLKGTVVLGGTGDCAQTWIATGLVYCADSRGDQGEVYKYPAGGTAVAVFSGNFDLPLGTVAVQQ
jgi:hypothetical protein